ncbi:MAG: phage tail protein [Methylocella sp.]
MPQYQKQGGKGGGNGPVQGYTYYTSFLMGLCEGPIHGYRTTFLNQQFLFYLNGSGLEVATGGSTPQAPWGYLSANYPGQALGYNGLAYVGAHNYNLGSSPNLPQFSFVLQGIVGPGQSIWKGNVVNGFDSDPALIIQDFLTNSQYGVLFPAASIDATTLLTTRASATVTISIAPPAVVTWAANGLANGQAVAFSTTGALPTGLTPGTVYYVVSATTNTFEVAAAAGGAPINTSGAQSGVHTAATADSSYQAYCRASYLALSPCLTNKEAANSILARWLQLTNTAAVWSGGKLKFIPYGDTAVTGPTRIGNVTFNPNITPVYNLADDDFIHEEGKDPLEIVRSDPYASYNWQRLQISWDGNGYYDTIPVVVWDQNAIELYGLRMASDITASEITDAGVGQVSAQLILQRGLYIRNTYNFKLSFEYCLLEPMDLVTVTDAGLGLTNVAIRITAIEEDDAGLLSVTAEEFPGGTATAVQYAVQTKNSNSTNQAVVPARVNPPTLYEPPAALTGGVAQVMAAVSGGIATAYLFAEDGSSGAHWATQSVVSSQLVLTPPNVITFSIYAQAATRSALRLNLFNGAATIGADFNLTGAGAFTADGGVTAAILASTSTSVWYQCTISCNVAATGTPVCTILLENPYLTSSYSGTSGDGVIIWGAAYSSQSASLTFLPAFSSVAGATLTTNGAATPEGVSGVADPNWGGAFVWISTDGNTYGNIGTVSAPARQGVLTAGLAAYSSPNPDIADTLSVSLIESGGLLSSGTDADAQNGVTLCLVDNELLAYATATLTGTNTYNLTYLYRGLYGAAAAAHSSGAPFTRIDSAVFQYPLPAAFIGIELFLKFQSFNIFGNAVEDLSECTVYNYTPSGAGQLPGPVTNALLLGMNLDFGLVSAAVSEADQWGIVTDGFTLAKVDLGAGI